MSCLKTFKRLKSHREFQKIYKNSKKWHVTSLISFYKPTKENYVGFTASKKVGSAVIRNRARRRLKALFIENCSILKNGTYIFVANINSVKVDYKTLKKDFFYSLKRLNSIIDDKL